MYHNAQDLVQKAVHGENYQVKLDFVTDFYATDFF